MTRRKKIALLIIISLIIISTIIIVIAPHTSPRLSIFLDKSQYTPGSKITVIVMNTGLKPVTFPSFGGGLSLSFYSIDKQRYMDVGDGDMLGLAVEWPLYPCMFTTDSRSLDLLRNYKQNQPF